MKSRIGSVICWVLLFSVPSLWAKVGDTSTNYVEGEVLVAFKPTADLPGARQALQRHSLNFAKHYSWLSEHRGQHLGLVRNKAKTTQALIAELSKDPAVETVEPNYVRHALGGRAPNDALFQRLWGLQNTGQSINGFTGTSGDDIHFTAAWDLARPSTNEVVVAVVDTGVHYTHPDLAANMWVNPGEIANNGADDDGDGYVDDYQGYNFADGTSDPSDSGSHGTHVSGTIAAVGNNQAGVIGVDYRAKVMALRASADGENFPESALIEAVQYATMMKNRGVNVVAINASYGGPGFSFVESSAIQAAGDAGIIMCVAAGNDGTNNDTIVTYPASYRLPNMIVVAATDQNDALADFSNYGTTTVDFAAPGVNVLSTVPPGITSYVHQAASTFLADALEFAGTTGPAGITAQLYDCMLGDPADFPPGVRGNLALISRGTLYFSEKVANAMEAGAVGAIIYNIPNGSLGWTLNVPSNWIPAVSISQEDGLTLKAALPASVTLFSALSPVPTYGYMKGTSMATPHVVGAVAFAAMNFPTETVPQRIQRILGNADPVAALKSKVRTGSRLNLQRIVDADANGLPDWWEQTYFGQLTGTDPNADPDQDGVTSLQEYIADTSPVDTSSSLRITSVQPTGNGMNVNWSGGTDSRLYLQRALSSGGPWLDVLTNEPPLSLNETFFDPAGKDSAAFYRLRVERP